jgi:adenosylcobinamide-GDP ribazoletransferase
MGTLPLARPTGLGADYAGRVDPGRATAGGAVAVVVAALASGWWALPLAAGAAVAAVGVALIAARPLGGVTGDVLGAVEQAAEGSVLVIVAGLAARHTVWWS